MKYVIVYSSQSGLLGISEHYSVPMAVNWMLNHKMTSGRLLAVNEEATKEFEKEARGLIEKAMEELRVKAEAEHAKRFVRVKCNACEAGVVTEKHWHPDSYGQGEPHHVERRQCRCCGGNGWVDRERFE